MENAKCPVISVVIPCYNYGKFLEEAIDSCLGSTFQDFEILVVDDGSTDTYTLELLKNMNKPKTRVIHQENRGVCEARNRGFREAKGEYVFTLDADDRIHPTLLEKAVRILETRPETGFVSCWLQAFGDEQYVWEVPPFHLGAALCSNIVPVAALIRKKAWSDAGGYNNNMRQGFEDWDFWISVGKKGWLGEIIPEPLFYNRLHGKETRITSASEKEEFLTKQIRENHRELYEEKKFFELVHDWLGDEKKAKKIVTNILGIEEDIEIREKISRILSRFSEISGKDREIMEEIKQLLEREADKAVLAAKCASIQNKELRIKICNMLGIEQQVEIPEKIRQILPHISGLSDDNRAFIKELLERDELETALRTICTMILEKNVHISRANFEVIFGAVIELQMDRTLCIQLFPFIVD